MAKIADLIPDSSNANKGTQRGLKALDNSLRQYGAGRSILIDKNGRVIAGNKTLERAADIGLDEVQIVDSDGSRLVAVRRTDLDLETDERARLLAYADNRVGQLDLDWNPEQLAADLSAGLDLSGIFDAGELEGIIGQALNGKGGDTPPQIDQAAKLAEKWGVKVGQVWQLDRHRVACGDCTDRAVVEGVMRGERATLEIHDPPYGMRLDADWSTIKTNDFAIKKAVSGGKKYNHILGDFDDFDPEFLFNRDMPKEMFLWGADYYCEKIPNRNNGSWIVWDKRIDESTDKMYGSVFELCWSLKKHKRDFIRVKWASLFGTEKEPGHERYHPAQKPVLVYEWLLGKYSNDGDIIGDYFLGAGSHLIACHNLNRVCRGIELDAGYIGVTLQRFFDHTGIEPVLIPKNNEG